MLCNFLSLKRTKIQSKWQKIYDDSIREKTSQILIHRLKIAKEYQDEIDKINNFISMKISDDDYIEKYIKWVLFKKEKPSISNLDNEKKELEDKIKDLGIPNEYIGKSYFPRSSPPSEHEIYLMASKNEELMFLKKQIPSLKSKDDDILLSRYYTKDKRRLSLYLSYEEDENIENMAGKKLFLEKYGFIIFITLFVIGNIYAYFFNLLILGFLFEMASVVFCCIAIPFLDRQRNRYRI